MAIAQKERVPASIFKRTETLQVSSNSEDLDLKVEKFQCQDEVAVGKHHKKWNWTFNFHGFKHEWFLKVDEAVVGPTTLHFMVDGKEIFKGKLSQDFEHKWPIRGSLKLNDDYDAKVLNAKLRGEAPPSALESGVDDTEQRLNYEVKGPHQLRGQDQWYPALLMGNRGDGSYEAEVFIPDERGKHRKVHYPIVDSDRIRDASTKNAVKVKRSTVCLVVKKDSVLWPELVIDGYSFKDHICVPTPAAKQPPSVINFRVSPDRRHVTADVGHGKLQEALNATRPSMEYSKPLSGVYQKELKKTKLKCEWVLCIGAFGEHRIVAETNSKRRNSLSQSSKEVNLSIDGNLVAGGTAADLGGTGNEWSIDIPIRGSLTLNFALNKITASGAPSNEIMTITKNMPHSNTIRITCPDVNNLEIATLECDAVHFGQLTQYKQLPSEPNISSDIGIFESTHGLAVPYAEQDTLECDMIAGFGSEAANFFSMFACCQSTVDEDADVAFIVKENPDENPYSNDYSGAVTKAATKIQAAHRGNTVRKSLRG